MTLLVGIRCSDGIVVAADQAVTFAAGQSRTIADRACKVDVIDNKLIVASTGEVGFGQRFRERVSTLWAGKALNNKSAIDVAKTVSRESIADFEYTGVPMGKVPLGALMAFPFKMNDKSGDALTEFYLNTFQPELKTDALWYVSMGSGQPLADPYLALLKHVFWPNKAPTVRHAVFAAAWVVTQSIRVAPAGIGLPMDMAVLVDGKARKLSEDEVQVHITAAEASIDHFAKFDPESGEAQGSPSPSPVPAGPGAA